MDIPLQDNNYVLQLRNNFYLQEVYYAVQLCHLIFIQNCHVLQFPIKK